MLVLGAAAVCAGCGCGPPTGSNLANGEAGVGGVIPYDAISSLVGERAGTLHWLIPNRTTMLHITVQPPTSIEQEVDCQGGPASFLTSLQVTGASDDGVLNLDGGIDMGWSTASAPPDPTLEWSPDWDTLREAGVTPAWAYGGFEAQFDVQTRGPAFQFENATIVMLGTPTSQPMALATVTFDAVTQLDASTTLDATLVNDAAK